VRSAGGVPVPLAQLLAPEFRTRRELMFSPDGFHPSSVTYALAADALLLALCDKLGGKDSEKDSAKVGEKDGEKVGDPAFDEAEPSAAPVLGQQHSQISVMSRLWRRPVPGPAPSSYPQVGSD
jgi:hypothetical protein